VSTALIFGMTQRLLTVVIIPDGGIRAKLKSHGRKGKELVEGGSEG